MADAHLIIEPAPDGWQDLEFGDLCDRVQESVQPVEGGRTPYVGLEHLAPGFPALLGHGVEGDVTSSKAGFRKGDILFGKLRPYLRKGAQPDFDGVCSTDILVFRAKEPGTPEYLKYLVHSDQFVERAKATTSGVQHPRTSWSSLREFKVTVPSHGEQQRIAQVLSTVQAAIEQQERLIRTTTELKQALMQKLFTEGLRGEAQKETEIGLVPESWEVVPLQSVCELVIDCPHTTPQFLTTGVRVARNFNIRDGRFVSEPAFFTSEEQYLERVRRAVPEPGDVLFSREAPVGEGCVIPEGMRLSLGQRTMLIRTDRAALLPEFLVYSFYAPALSQYMKSIASGLTVAHLNVSDVRTLPIPLPSIEVQRAIADALLAVERKGEQHRTKLTALQALFRTLLHELMTGKVRVAHEVTEYTSVRA